MVCRLALQLACFLGTLCIRGISSEHTSCKSASDASILLQSTKQTKKEPTEHVEMSASLISQVPSLSTADLAEVIKNCNTGVAKLRTEPTEFRMAQIVIMPHSSPLDFHALFTEGARPELAPPGSTRSAAAKAWTALAVSSNQSALTSRAVGQLYSEPLDMKSKVKSKDPRHPGINTLPGGIPLYKAEQLIGAVGVSGELRSELAEAIAAACATGFQAPVAIQLGRPYLNATNPLPALQQTPAESKESAGTPNPSLFLSKFLLGWMTARHLWCVPTFCLGA